MLSRQENEFLTRTDAGTPMGEFIRRFWLPVAVASELPRPDGDPQRIRLLGEDLVMFRDSEGRVGLLEEACPHRLASLYYGRNEQGGLRCIYHGWKFDALGNCLDMPSEPPSSNFKHKVKAKAYPTREAGGLVWAYMGPLERMPELPGFEWLDLPATHRYASRWVQESNFVQAIEGEFDTSHVGFLHSTLQLDENKTALTGSYFHDDLAPKWHIEHADYGMVAASCRHVDADRGFWRMNQFLLPFYSMIPPVPGNARNTRAWVPRDDGSCAIIAVSFRPDRPLGNDEIAHWEAGRNTHRDVIPGTATPRFGRHNEYGQDRRKQRTVSFSGIEGVRNQDACVTESQGRIVDRSREHLGTGDAALIQLRKRMIDGARALLRGEEPLAACDGGLYRIRAGSAVVARGLGYDDTPEIRASNLVM